MIGHCGGLRQSQSIGDYVLAHAYMRRDGILDRVLPPQFRCRRWPRCSRRCRMRLHASPGSRARR